MGRPKVAGSVSRRGDRWLAQLPPSLGRRGKVCDTEAAAWEWLRVEGARAIITGPTPRNAPPQVDTLASLLARWIEAAPIMKDSTRASYRKMSERVPARYGNLPVADVRPTDVDAIVRHIPANWSRANFCAMFSSFWSWAEANDYTDRNPYRRSSASAMAKMVRLQAEPREHTGGTWTPAEFQRFLAAEDDPVFRALWTFYACTAARRGEGVGARWDALHDGWCWLQTNVTLAGSRVVVDELPKGWRRRKAYFGPETAATIEALRVLGSPWIFPKTRSWGRHARAGDHMSPPVVTARFNRLSRELGLPRLTGPHGLRRTYGTLAEAEGFRETVRKAALGHRMTVSDRYTPASEAELRELAERIEKLMLG